MYKEGLWDLYNDVSSLYEWVQYLLSFLALFLPWS